ncbi:substrate-binding domain-containing protein, partial [Pseudomonas fluorescens]|uniref:substrate-binding domain-containing protein n=1 Tax=Pseudomonas fluorescens TaxID=294 RepID=UPI0004BE4423
MRLSVVFFLGFWLPCGAWADRLPIPEHGPALRLQGSNTIGAALGPALVRGLMENQGLLKVSAEITGRDNEQRIVGQTAEGQRVTVDIAAHGSSTGFTALKQANADLAASSRPIKESELKDLAALGDLKSPTSEQVIAIDGLAIILHSQNPLRQLDTVQLARIFSGEAKTWEAVGGVGGAIHLYAR